MSVHPRAAGSEPKDMGMEPGTKAQSFLQTEQVGKHWLRGPTDGTYTPTHKSTSLLGIGHGAAGCRR